MADSLVITWGTPLYGCIRLGGAKNASYKLMIASLLGDSETRLLNIPGINDVTLVREVITLLGWSAKEVGNKTLRIDPSITSWSIPDEFGEKSRASMLFLGPLLAKFGKAEIPLPGGDKIGARPLDRSLDWLAAMGATREQKGDRLYLEAKELRGTTYRFEKNSHTWTEIMLMAASMAKGKTILENAALEPEIDDMIKFLNAMGAKIRRRAFKVIEIEWVEKLHGAIHTVMPDRNEAVTYACAALISKGDIIIENAQQENLEAFLEKIDEAWGGYEIGDRGIRFFYKWPLRATDITTMPHPGFMTDWQALWAVLMCTAEWTSTIHETIFPNRFIQYTDILQAMGASFTTFSPEVDNPEKLYNFNWDPSMVGGHYALQIHGPAKFTGGEFSVHDLRAWATALLAWLVWTWTTILHNIEQIERWYEQIEKKLKKLWAKLEKK